MNQEGHPKDIKSNFKGANRSLDPELSGAKDDGTYFEGQNGRTTDVKGNSASFNKIKGEEVEHPSNGNPGDWFCLGTTSVNGKKFEIWVDKDEVEAPIVRIDGVIVGNSDRMPWNINYPVQMDKNENCLGGEVFITDDNTPPMILNIGDMLDSLVSNPTRYFQDFNPDLYTINLSAPLDIPVFIGLENVGGGGGLPVGEYQYSIRYVNEDGDRTNWGPYTPPIPVLQSLGSGSNQYPGTKSYGGAPNLASNTSYGIKLRFRVTNLVDYDFIEVKRIAYNTGAGIDVIPSSEIVAKLDITEGEISVRDFIDPSDSNVSDTLADEDDIGELAFIEKAKAIRYYDKKLVLMNIQTAARDSEVTFEEYNGEKIFPIVQKIGKQGHNDPRNHTYYRNYQSGEKYSFGINLFDGIGGRGFAIDHPDLRNIQVPNRRDIANTNSQELSYGGMPDAANVSGYSSKTFEVFDNEDASTKSDLCSFKNIMNHNPGALGDESVLVAGKSSIRVNSAGCPDAGLGVFVQAREVGYKPYTPVNPNDDTVGHDYRVNTHIHDGSGEFEYNPKGFGIDYYSKGFAIAGISNIPSWAKAFSVVRSEPADRVVCQGLGFYSLNPGDFNLVGNASAATKEKNKFWFFSPDLEAGLVNQATIDDMNANPQNYKVQFISPLGFFSEVYNFENNTVASARDRLVDMITYARVLTDNGEINAAERSNMGYVYGGKNYVAYNRYRNLDNVNGGAFSGGGNTVFGINGFNPVAEGRGEYFELDVDTDIYNTAGSGGTGSNDFIDDGMRNFTEPLYIINIIREGAEVRDRNIDEYKNTGAYQKIESIIGQGDGSPDQSYILVDERWEDCIPDLSSTGPWANDEAFVYLRDDEGNEETYMDSTFLTPAQVTTIVNDINLNGSHTTSGGVVIKGLYTHINQNDTTFYIEFNVPNFYPTGVQKIYVKYNSNRPLRVFGGDTTIGETLFSPIDREADATDDADTTQFVNNIGLPYRRFKMNPRHYVIADTTGANKIQDELDLRLGYLRQLCVMFACESKVATHYAYSGGYPDQSFPLVHYVMRPNRFDDSSFPSADPIAIANDNNLFEEYFDDYPEEYLYWKFGGFRFKQLINIDYSKTGPIEYFSQPDFGFTPENKFCTAVVWSLPRAINQQDSPGLKTFIPTNRIDIDDDTGEIKKAYDARTGGKGDNLYAITENGVCLLLTKKSILSNLEGDDLSTTNIDDFIGGQYWLTREIGSNDEMWRGMGEGSVTIPTEAGDVERESLFFPNKTDIYRLTENQIVAISGDYYNRILPILDAVKPGFETHMTGQIIGKYNEYWLQIDADVEVKHRPYYDDKTESSRVLVYQQGTNAWAGTFTHDFDKYLSLANDFYGMRGLETYKLDSGFKINGAPIECFMIQKTSPGDAEKEFIRVQVNTGKRGTMKPSRVEFYDEEIGYMCALDEAQQGALYLKQYDGWEQFIPRKDGAISNERERVQGRLLLYKIIHNFEEEFKIVKTLIQQKILK